MVTIVTEDDKIVLESLASFISGKGFGKATNEIARIQITQQAMNSLYKQIIPRVPRIATYILQAPADDNAAKGLFNALTKHVTAVPTGEKMYEDSGVIFVQQLMVHLGNNNNPNDNIIVGALLTKIMSKVLEERAATAATTKKPVQTKSEITSKKSDKDKTMAAETKEETTVAVTETEEKNVDLKHVYDAIQKLLGGMATIIATKSANLTMNQSISIAACIAMNNAETLKELIASDMPITADVLDVLDNTSLILAEALKLNKSDYPKLTANQAGFVESLKRYVFERLNMLSEVTILQFLWAAYGSHQVDLSTKLINIRDCGPQYPNLLVAAKSF